GTRPVADPFAARKCIAHERMRFPTLEFLEGPQIGVLVVQMNHEANRYEAVVIVIEKRAATRAVVERPAQSVLYQPWPVAIRRNLPQFLEADAEFRRLAIPIEPETGDQRFGQMASRAFGEQRIFAAQLHAAGERVLRLAIATDTHVASRNADNLAA